MRKRLTIAMVVLGMLVCWIGASTASCSNTRIVGEGPEISGTGERMRSHLLFFTEPGTHELLEQEDVLLVFWELWVVEGGKQRERHCLQLVYRAQNIRRGSLLRADALPIIWK